MEIPKPFVKNGKIVNAIPKEAKTILEVGAGDGHLSGYLDNWYLVKAIDIDPPEKRYFNVKKKNVLDYNKKHDVVIASEVLEHIEEWWKVLKKMVELAEMKLIITVPLENRIKDPGHIIHFDEESMKKIKEFYSDRKVEYSSLDGRMYFLEIYAKN
jgi:trans-aconitate methyltransferase